MEQANWFVKLEYTYMYIHIYFFFFPRRFRLRNIPLWDRDAVDRQPIKAVTNDAH